jgi:UDP-glucose:(glucosyl)LPS alpha-1,2-glucosyltransferase
MTPTVAMVLPPREGFAPGATGAVGLMVQRLAGHPGAFPGTFAPVVLGMPQAAPFAGIQYRGIRLSWLPLRQADRYARGVARAIRALRPALIEVHNRPDVARYLARRFPALPVCLFLHNDPQGMRGTRNAAGRARLLAETARVAVVSDYLRSRLLEGVAAPARPPAVLPNCIDLRDIPASPEPRENLILFAGRVVSDKGADGFVAACARALPRLAGWRAEMIGADRFGPDSPETPWLRALRPQAEAAGVTMTGYQLHEAVLSAMARAAIVVVPSRWAEPFGLTALEAMACGAALLCARTGGLPEVVGDAALPVDPDDPACMAESIVALARDPARMAALGSAGRQRAQGFDLPLAAQRLDALRRDVLASCP